MLSLTLHGFTMAIYNKNNVWAMFNFPNNMHYNVVVVVPNWTNLSESIGLDKFSFICLSLSRLFTFKQVCVINLKQPWVTKIGDWQQ